MLDFLLFANRLLLVDLPEFKFTIVSKILDFLFVRRSL